MSEPTPEESADAAAGAAAELLAEAARLESPSEAAAESTSVSRQSADGPKTSPDLSDHARGLLRIGVPVAVTLAAQRTSVKEIVELVPGAIIKFDKTCDEPLDLCVGNQPIATGEVVKVGDKFGLRVGRLNKVDGK
jgi:flagellar motor switch protein FliN/FliY